MQNLEFQTRGGRISQETTGYVFYCKSFFKIEAGTTSAEYARESQEGVEGNRKMEISYGIVNPESTTYPFYLCATCGLSLLFAGKNGWFENIWSTHIILPYVLKLLRLMQQPCLLRHAKDRVPRFLPNVLTTFAAATTPRLQGWPGAVVIATMPKVLRRAGQRSHVRPHWMRRTQRKPGSEQEFLDAQAKIPIETGWRVQPLFLFQTNLGITNFDNDPKFTISSS